MLEVEVNLSVARRSEARFSPSRQFLVRVCGGFAHHLELGAKAKVRDLFLPERSLGERARIFCRIFCRLYLIPRLRSAWRGGQSRDIESGDVDSAFYSLILHALNKRYLIEERVFKGIFHSDAPLSIKDEGSVDEIDGLRCGNG